MTTSCSLVGSVEAGRLSVELTGSCNIQLYITGEFSAGLLVISVRNE